MTTRDQVIDQKFADVLYYTEVAEAYRQMFLALPDVSTPESRDLCRTWSWARRQRERASKALWHQ